MRLSIKHLGTKLASASLLFLAFPIFADTPVGWIDSHVMSAYTTTRGEFELSGSLLAVNDTLDFLDVRDDLLAANRRLAGSSGDLSGTQFEIYYGITDYLSVFGSHRNQDMTVELGTISSANILDLDNSLDTQRQELGLKWMIYQGNLLASNDRHSALSLQVSGVWSESKDFDVVIDEFQLGDFTLRFTNPQTFSVNDLEDDSWQARLIYTAPIFESGIGSFWLGYGESDAQSGTGSDIVAPSIAEIFRQQFQLEEEYLYLGLSLNFTMNPRLPISLSYEYIDRQDIALTRTPEQASASLPGFLNSAGVPTESGNHTLKAQASYWITPQLYLSLTGNLYSNQFLGELPHYSNPLSESFSSVTYGYAGLKLGFKF